MDLVSYATVSNHMNDGILNILIKFADKAAQMLYQDWRTGPTSDSSKDFLIAIF